MGVPNFLGCRISCDTGGGTYGAGLVPRRGPGSDYFSLGGGGAQFIRKPVNHRVMHFHFNPYHLSATLQQIVL